MKLNHFTDYSLRILVYLKQKKSKSSSVTELAEKLGISRNHVIKMVQFLAQKHLIITKRGKGGGIVISEEAYAIKLGDLIHLLEQDDTPVINCQSKLCIFMSHSCKLKIFLDIAYNNFIESLNQQTLSDIFFNDWDKMFSNVAHTKTSS